MRDSTIDIAALRQLLVDRDWSMAELARRSGVSYSLIKYVMAGRFQFSDYTAPKIAKALRCDLADFTTPTRRRGVA